MVEGLHRHLSTVLTDPWSTTGAATQKPIQGAVVDIWHADANGAYSGFVAASASANGGERAARASGAPYWSRGTRDVRNANDGIYSGGGAPSTLVVQKVSGGYATTMNTGVKSA